MQLKSHLRYQIISQTGLSRNNAHDVISQLLLLMPFMELYTFTVLHIRYSHVHLHHYIPSCIQHSSTMHIGGQNSMRNNYNSPVSICTAYWGSVFAVESHWSGFWFGYSLGPKMVDPILTFVLPSSIWTKTAKQYVLQILPRLMVLRDILSCSFPPNFMVLIWCSVIPQT
jgi:hypothetical protein